MTLRGDSLACFSAQSPMSIAVHDNHVAVGIHSGAIELHCHPGGALIRSFGMRGPGPGLIGGFATGLRFTPDGRMLLLSERLNNRLSLFSITGAFVKHIGVGTVVDGCKDVSFVTSGEIVVADFAQNRICVFSSDGDQLLKCWNADAAASIVLNSPSGLAVAGTRMYVMDNSRVLVFE